MKNLKEIVTKLVGLDLKDLEAINESHQKLVGSLMSDKKKPQWDDTE